MGGEEVDNLFSMYSLKPDQSALLKFIYVCLGASTKSVVVLRLM